MQCSFGTAPASLVVTSQVQTKSGGMLAATINDFAPTANIPPFGMCTTTSNPTVASATAAASGVLTPQPCIPVTTPWTPGSATHKIGGFPALNNTCKCNCSWGGVISITYAGQTTESIP